MKRIVELVVDLQNKIYNTIFLKQMDTTIIKVKILNDNTIVDLTSQTIDIIFTKPNSTLIQQLASNIDIPNGIATIPLLEECVRQSGKAKMEIEVKNTNSEVTSSFYIPVQIEQTSKAAVSPENTENYFEEFSKAIDDFVEESSQMLEDISSAEATRVTNENNRISAENTRKTNETNRINAETARVAAETARATAEATRVTNENNRISAENTRKTNETNRTNAETARVVAEKARATAEQNRVTSFNQMMQNVNVQAVQQNTADIAEIKEKMKVHVYGVRRKLANNSSSTWERIEDAVGLVANAQKGSTAVQNSFDNLYPWSDIISYNYDVKSQRITAYYGEPTFKFDGSNGEVLTRIPEFWYKRTRDDTYEYVYIADGKKEGYIKSEQFSVGRYTMSGSNSRVYSKSGVAPLVSDTITNFRTYARNLGDGFGQLDWHYFLFQILYLVEYADYNAQDKLGKGVISKEWTGSFNGVNSGGCDSLGMKSGTLNDDGQHSMIYRGIEDIYGALWQFVDGINIKDYKAYISQNSNDYAVDKFDGSYKALGYTNCSTTGQYQSAVGYDANNPIIDFATAVGGASNTYMTDYYWCAEGNRIALVRWCLERWLGLWLVVLDFEQCFFVIECHCRRSPS